MTPKWMEIASKEIGQHEVDGKGNNPRIIQYHATTSLHATEDSVPWCASFVNWCMNQAGIQGTNSAAAASWINWGAALTQPVEGCITVIRQKFNGSDHKTGSSSGNHVAFFKEIKDGRIYLLGGNQSDSVKVSSFGLNSYSVIAYRWPKEET